MCNSRLLSCHAHVNYSLSISAIIKLSGLGNWIINSITTAPVCFPYFPTANARVCLMSTNTNSLIKALNSLVSIPLLNPSLLHPSPWKFYYICMKDSLFLKTFFSTTFIFKNSYKFLHSYFYILIHSYLSNFQWFRIIFFYQKSHKMYNTV